MAVLNFTIFEFRIIGSLMSNEIEHIEYDRDVNTYPSFGKKYNSERAIISLTSWKARINTVGKTIYSLLKNCPGFHIVLVLSEEEFPKKEKELPEDLMLLANANIFEILWVYKNYKSFKKVLFTMDKYRDVPVISADDDCLYTCNYAEDLYTEWQNHKDCFITYKTRPYKRTCYQWGCASLYPPNYFKKFPLKLLSDEIIANLEDDVFYAVLREKLDLVKYRFMPYSYDKILVFHSSISPLHDMYKKNRFAIYEKLVDELYSKNDLT